MSRAERAEAALNDLVHLFSTFSAVAAYRGFAMGVVLPVWPIATVTNLHFEWQKTAYLARARTDRRVIC